MGKLYIFGIGGTGSRVIKALSMLFAAGVKLENGFDTVVPIIIDPDTSNGDLNRTKDILRLYQEIRNQVKDPNDFYRQEVKTVNELATQNKTISPDYFQFKLSGVDSSTFSQYIGFDSLSEDYQNSKDDKNFVRLLYSESNLNSDLSVGFKGNPNMGSIVLNQFTNSEDFKRFGQTFGPQDAIFIINSIFGGTGAAGFPLLLKNLRGNNRLLNHAQIKDSPIGGITYLPYFTLDKQGEVNAESFEEKAKIAIDYYNRTIINQRKINVLHFVGNRGNTNAEEYAVGGSDQKNKAHFLEIAGALAIIEFCKNIASYTCTDGKTNQATQIKEFGIERETETISFDDLNIENKNQFYKPLTKFRLYTQYLNEGLKRAKNVSRWTRSNFFAIDKHKMSPCNDSYFKDTEYKNQISAFNTYFMEWVSELAKNKPSFNPFFEVISSALYKKIDTQNCLLIDKLILRSREAKHTTLVKIFGLSTENIYKNVPIRVSEATIKAIKVFRLHQGQEGTGWFISAPLDKDDLKTIKTEGKDVATSIPSPFARIDLVKSAFDWITFQVKAIVASYPPGTLISNEDKLRIKNIIEGNTAQHRLVSDALDVAQLFYKCQNYKDKIEIITWKPSERFKDLIENSQNRNHSKFAETLKIFWDQDSVSPTDFGNLTLYNFEHVNRLYFVINKSTRQIIGGTSPATLFFTSPDVREATRNLNIVCGQDKLFDDIYFPLHKREVSFIEYIYAFAKQNDNFAIYFPEVNSYLKQIRDYLLQDDIQTIVSNLTQNSISKFSACPVRNNDNDPCEIINLRLGVQGIDEKSIENDSDFVIKSDFEDFNNVWDVVENKYKTTLRLSDGTEVKPRPLVLPYDKFTKSWTFTTLGILWNENTKIPIKNVNNNNISILPVQGDQYPWFSVGNFLEEKIIEFPYSIDSAKFKTCGARKHLLPLTPLFFKYFSIEKVDRILKLEERAGGGIEAILEIPVKKGKITFKKLYHQEDILKLDIHLAILPFLKPVKSKLDYTIGIIDDRPDKSEDVSITCFDKGQDVLLSGSSIIRNPGIQDVKSFYYKINETFDAVYFGLSSFKNFIIPNLQHCNENNQITFAVDFGTTNTHIEYIYGENVSVSLDNSEASPIFQSLLNRRDSSIDRLVSEREETFEKELLPFLISNRNSETNFPLRTALVHNKQINFTKPLEVFRQTNNYLLFEKRSIPNYLDLLTQLKWSNYAEPKDEIKVKSYIEFLMSLVFYKTLLLDGDPQQTKIIWFYPVSMEGSENSDGELGVFIKIWKEVYNKVFHIDNYNNLIQVPESVAPYLFYKSSVAGLSLSIDIGGGSSDIAVFDERSKNAILISSFKFAGNAIFGDGYPSKEFRNDSDKNGFVQCFKQDALNAVEEDSHKKAILSNIINVRKDSADFSSFLFSLEQDKNKEFSYTRLLEKNKRLKLSIMVFYGAVAYYSAKLLKKAGIDIPKYILLSGTAAKTASILDSSAGNLKNLSAMFKYIFEKVYDIKLEREIVLEVSQMPKEITCKGALKSGTTESVTENVIKFWLGGLRDDKWSYALDKDKDIKITPKYKDIDSTVKTSIKEAILDFYHTLDDYTNNVRFESKYLIEQSAYEKFKDIRDVDIEDYLIRGLKAFYKKEDKHIEETLFFYPLIGILNKLTFELSKNEL